MVGFLGDVMFGTATKFDNATFSLFWISLASVNGGIGLYYLGNGGCKVQGD